MGSVNNLEECLELLRGEKDEKRLVGLLLATKFCKGDDKDSIIKIFDALGIRFLERLLKTGTGTSTGMNVSKDKQDAYLQLAITVFSAFCHVPELASSDDVISNLSLILEILKQRPEPPISLECLECILGVAMASEKGLLVLYALKALPSIADFLCRSNLDSSSLELAVRLIQFILAKCPSDREISEYREELASLVVCLSKEFAFQQTSVKFDILQLLSTLMASDYSVSVKTALCSKSRDVSWQTYIRVGIGTILQNRVDADKKNLVLILAESMMETFGEQWLIGPMNLPGEKNILPYDRCFLLVLETARVEIAVLLNELARLKFDPSANSASSLKEDSLRRYLANIYSLIESIIKLVAEASEKKDSKISESTMLKAINAINESVAVVIDFLRDAKSNCLIKDDDVLASIRILGRYLAETPSAYEEHFQGLLGYLLSVMGDAEERPFLSVQFLLPVLCMCTLDYNGCQAFVSCGGHREVIKYVIQLCTDVASQESIGTILLACDTILNVLTKKDEFNLSLEIVDFVSLIPPLLSLAECQSNSTLMAVCSCISVLVLDLSDENLLSKYPGQQNQTLLNRISHHLVQCLELYCQHVKENILNEEQDLYDIMIPGCTRIINRYPSIRRALAASSWIEILLRNKFSVESILEETSNTFLQDLLANILADMNK